MPALFVCKAEHTVEAEMVDETSGSTATRKELEPPNTFHKKLATSLESRAKSSVADMGSLIVIAACDLKSRIVSHLLVIT